MECTRVSKICTYNKGGHTKIGKVKQAIQEVEEEVISLVKDGFNLRDIKLSLGYWADENPYMLNEKLIEQSFNKAIWERDNEEEYNEQE